MGCCLLNLQFNNCRLRTQYQIIFSSGVLFFLNSRACSINSFLVIFIYIMCMLWNFFKKLISGFDIFFKSLTPTPPPPRGGGVVWVTPPPHFFLTGGGGV